MRSALTSMMTLGRHQGEYTEQPAWLGMQHALIAVVLFSLTVPMTEIALISFSPESIAFVRAGLAGAASLLIVLLMEFKGRWRVPTKQEVKLLIPASFVVCGVFPYTLSDALQARSSADMGVLLAGIPLITAIVASVFFSERHSKGFWFSTLAGTGLLIAFNALSSPSVSGWFDALIIVVSAAVGYSIGGKVARTLGGWQTICWMCLLYLPVSLLGAGYFVGLDARALQQQGMHWDTQAVYALLYLALISQWFGFHFWYGAMAKAGIAKVGMVQLTQPFFTLLFSVWLLSETLHGYQIVFAVLICMAVLSAIRNK